jgi:hypothetical protein
LDDSVTPGPDSDTGPADRQVEFYWRRGRGFCSSLSRGLEHAGVELVEHDIRADDDARAFVRSVARGTETAIGVALVNPSAAAVVACLDAATTDVGATPP